jgi:hypothetical protein
LTAKRATISWPVEMPPRMPPAWFEEKPARRCPIEDLVGVLNAGQRRRRHARADLHALDRVDRHHRGGDVGVELGVDRRAEARGHAFRADLDHGADRVSRLAQGVEVSAQAAAAAASGHQNGLRSVSSQSQRAGSIAMRAHRDHGAA